MTAEQPLGRPLVPPTPAGSASGQAVSPWGWAAAGLAGLLAVGLFVDALGWATEYEGFSWLMVTSTLPPLLLAAGYGALAVALVRASVVAPWAGVVLAACTVVAACDENVPGPGGFVAVGAILLACAVLVVSPAGDAARGPNDPVEMRAVRTCAVWLALAGAAGAGVAFGWATEADAAARQAFAGLVFVTVVGGAVLMNDRLGKIACGRESGAVLRTLRLLAAVSSLAGVVAALMTEAGQIELLAVGVLGLAVLALITAPSRMRALAGETPLAPVRNLESAVGGVRDSLVPAIGSAGPPGTVEGLARRANDALPQRLRNVPSWMKFGAIGMIVLGIVAAVLAGTSASDGESQHATLAVVSIVGALVAAAAVFTPTMPTYWRAGCAGAALLGIVAGAAGFSGTYSDRWMILFGSLPLAIAIRSVWGAIANQRNGVTSTSPGWIGQRPRLGPPGRPLTFATPVTAKGRSRLRLQIDTGLDAATVLDHVRAATGVRGNWFVVGGDHVDVQGKRPDELALSITNSWKLHATFRAVATGHGRRTQLIVGGLDTWTQSRMYYYGFIPAGPASVKGYWMYLLFLQTVAGELRHVDPSVRASIGGPA
ncbi:hypothetical protein [Pseudonocardia phyllosphaerae]|uniref:hypothetical protein n=1 Tax=Pseudonocardia phyllosphaerae TaxID=3390502 RepID=UPI003979C888